MEIKPQALPVFAPGLGGVSGNAGREEAVPEAPAGASGTSGAHTATQALCDAACDLLQAQARRNQAHVQAAGLAAQALGRGGIDYARLDSLQESLAGVALSEKLDKPREDAAGVRLLGLLRQAGAGQTDGSSTPLALTPYAAGAMPTASAASGQTLNDIWEELAGKISTAEGSDLKPHASAVEQYTKLYQGLSNILSDVGKWVRPDGDNHMKVDFKKMEDALKALKAKYDGSQSANLIVDNVSKEEAEEICKQLGLDAGQSVVKRSSGKYFVRPDISQLERMLRGLPSTNNSTANDYKISIAAYNAWKAGFDAQMSRVEDALQTRGQRYSNAYSRFENFHKVISSIIQSMADALRQFLQF